MGMNIYRIAIFMFLINLALTLITLANVPITCNSTGTGCIFFSADTMSSTSMSQILSGNIKDGQYKSVQIETNIDQDLYTATAAGLGVLVNFIYVAILGMYLLVPFFFGSNALTIGFGLGLQSLVWFFYGRSLLGLIKLGGGDV